MPATANIVVADATPTNHTFKPQAASLALSTWSENSATTFEGNGRLAVTMSQPNSTRKTTREKMTFVLPIERTVEGVVKVADTITYILEAVIPATCSETEALKAYTIYKNLVQNSLISSYLVQREPCY